MEPDVALKCSGCTRRVTIWRRIAGHKGKFLKYSGASRGQSRLFQAPAVSGTNVSYVLYVGRYIHVPVGQRIGHLSVIVRYHDLSGRNHEARGAESSCEQEAPLSTQHTFHCPLY